MILLLFSLLAVSSAQWILVQPASPPLVTTDPSAHPQMTPYPLIWSDEGDTLYLLAENMWKYEIETKRWIWMPNVPKDLRRVIHQPRWTIQNKLYTPSWYYDPLVREFTNLPMGQTTCQGSAFWKHEVTNKLYMWGGVCENNQTVDTLRAFDISSQQWSTVTTTGSVPTANAFVAATRVGENGVYLYANDHLYYLDLSSKEWSQSELGKNGSPPGPDRIFHSMWTLQNGDIMLYGGQSGSKHYTDTWKYSNKEWQMVDEGNGPAPFSNPNGFATTSDLQGNLFYYDSQGAVYKYGKLTVRNIFQLIDWKLDSATFSASIAAIMSSIVFFGLLLLTMVVCIRYCIRKRKKKHGIPLLHRVEDEAN